jgi:hypothetical protein
MKVSAELAKFLENEEEEEDSVSLNSGRSNTKSVHDALTTAISFLLQPITMKRIVVGARSNFEVKLQIKQAGLIVLWEFSTEVADIAFSVVFDKKMVRTYQRYESHLKTIQGSFSPPCEGICVLSWDNR